jgi:hypothetical protein
MGREATALLSTLFALVILAMLRRWIYARRRLPPSMYSAAPSPSYKIYRPRSPMPRSQAIPGPSCCCSAQAPRPRRSRRRPLPTRQAEIDAIVKEISPQRIQAYVKNW